MRRIPINNSLVALLVVGSAISLLSCVDHQTTSTPVSYETLMSESSDSLTVIVSENGRRSYRFESPLVEGYSMAREPYREFRKGIFITTYLNDSLMSVDSKLRSNYAIYYSNLELWEAKGDVVVIKHDGKELYTQQLFWNSKTERIYSNVDTKIIDTNNGDVYQGEGFESDEAMEKWSFRKMTGRMRVDTSPTEPDSTAVASTPQSQSSSVEQTPPRESDAKAAQNSDLKPLKSFKEPLPREVDANPDATSRPSRGNSLPAREEAPRARRSGNMDIRQSEARTATFSPDELEISK